MYKNKCINGPFIHNYCFDFIHLQCKSYKMRQCIPSHGTHDYQCVEVSLKLTFYGHETFWYQNSHKFEAVTFFGINSEHLSHF